MALLILLLSSPPWQTGHLAIAQSEPDFPIRFDAGSDHPTMASDNRLYMADQPWSPENPFGYVGGYRVWTSEMHPVDGTEDAVLHENQRHGWEAYRFGRLPRGDYLVTLSFSEIGVPTYDRFDVAIEGETVLHAFRIAEADGVGSNYALTRRFAVHVTDGELTVTATPIVGHSRLAAIEVDRRPPDGDAPAVPVGLETLDGYGALLLDWSNGEEDDLDGYHIYRATVPGGPYLRLTTTPVHISRYADTSVVPHIPYYYRLSAVDVYGNESQLSPPIAGAASSVDDARLPVYELNVSLDDMQRLDMHALDDDAVPGTFIYDGRRFSVTVRYRGGVGRYFHKKSWKIRFVDESPFPDRDRINLRAEYPDPSLMRNRLATALFEAVGIPVPSSDPVLLMLNGEYQGVYMDTERVDERFLERIGRDPTSPLYKTLSTEQHDFSRAQSSIAAYRAAYEKETSRDTGYEDIIALIELINRTPDDAFPDTLSRVFDVPAYLDYYAVIVFTANRDFIAHNVYFLYDPFREKWELIPYDLDEGFRKADRPLDMGTANAPLFEQGFSSLLLTRVLDVPQFRAYYCHRLAELLDSVFSEEAMSSLIDQTYAAIEQGGLRDWHKRYREDNAHFAAAPDELNAFVAARRDFLRSQMPAYCPADQPYLAINEVRTDSEGESGWIEVYNRALEPVDLRGLYLTNDLRDPTRFRVATHILVPAGGFALFQADGDPSQGPRHTNFSLGGPDGVVGIYSGTVLLDALDFALTGSTQSVGRYPDGTPTVRTFRMPTPGASNQLHPPTIYAVTHTPRLPTAADPVTVTAWLGDDSAVLTATLEYRVEGGTTETLPLSPLGGSVYQAHIPPQVQGSRLTYRVVAGDDDGQVARSVEQAYIVDYRAPTIRITEVMADNRTTLADPDEPHAPGEFPDWIELYNPGPDPVDLGGRYLTDDLNDPTRFQIATGTVISPGAYLLFYADNDPEQGARHTNFRLAATGESVALFDHDAGGRQPLDVVTDTMVMQPDVSAGRCGTNGTWHVLDAPTPGRPNQACGTVGYGRADWSLTLSPSPLVIAEFMAHNVTTLEDPDDPGEFPDWIELYNASPRALDLSGKYLSDDVTNPTRFRIPDGVTIPPRGFLVFFADGEPEQGPLHTNFSLNRYGEAIALFDTDEAGRRLLDVRFFGRQWPDRSECRRSVAGGNWVEMCLPSPGWEDGDPFPTPYLPLVLRKS